MWHLGAQVNAVAFFAADHVALGIEVLFVTSVVEATEIESSKVREVETYLAPPFSWSAGSEYFGILWHNVVHDASAVCFAPHVSLRSTFPAGDANADCRRQTLRCPELPTLRLPCVDLDLEAVGICVWAGSARIGPLPFDDDCDFRKRPEHEDCLDRQVSERS